MSSGWIKTYRELLDKPIWHESTPEQKSILITLMLMANSQETQWEWRGEPYTALPGQFVTSLEKIAAKAGKGITSRNVRTALNRFEKYGFLSNQSTNKNRLITIVNWGVYQSPPSETVKQTVKQQSGNSQATVKQQSTNKNLRIKELENKEKDNVQEEAPDQLTGQVRQVIAYLNSKTGKKFKDKSKDTQKLIHGRIHDGYSVGDFKKVIDNKCSEWLDDPNMDKFLRPATLFSPKHFEEYLNEKPLKNKPSAYGSGRKPVKETLPDWAKDDYQPTDTTGAELSAEQRAKMAEQLKRLNARQAQKET